MIPLAWLALSVALVLSIVPAAAPIRAGRLAGAGRLVPAPERTGRAPRDRGAGGGHAGRSPRLGGVPHVALLGVGVALLVSVQLLAGPALAIAAGAILATLAVLVRDALDGRRALADHRELLVAVRLLVAELGAGSRPAAAFDAAATAGPAVAGVLGRAAALARDGGDPSAALESDPRPSVRAVGLAWRVGHDTGAALGSVLERVAADLAAADDQRRAVAVVLAGPRSSAALLSLLPALGIALGTSMGASPVGFLTAHPAGRAVCLGGVLLDVGGLLWMRAILRRAART